MYAREKTLACSFFKGRSSGMCRDDFTQPKYPGEDHLLLSLDSFHDVKSLTSLVDQTKIRSISIRHQSLTTLSVNDITCLFDTLGRFPNLEHFRVQFLEDATTEFSALAAALRQAHRLVRLELHFFDLDANTRDTKEFCSFTESLKAQSSLKEFKLSFSRFSSLGTRLNSIVQALATVPKLEKIQIFVKRLVSPNPCNGGSTKLDISFVDLLSHASNLEILKVSGVKLQYENVLMVANALQSNNSVKHLSLTDCGLDSNCAIHFAHLLQTNTILEKLDLSWNNVGDTGCMAIAKALATNSTLSALYLHKDEGVTDQSCEGILYMLERNFSITDLWTNMANKNTRDKVQFYLNLNKEGKRHILQKTHPTLDEWHDVLVSYQNDLSSLFYYISKNPLIFNRC